jgi:hypothetical protein
VAKLKFKKLFYVRAVIHVLADSDHQAEDILMEILDRYTRPDKGSKKMLADYTFVDSGKKEKVA